MRTIIINYDFINALKNVNEKYSIKKPLRNRKTELLLGTSILFTINQISSKNVIKSIELLGIELCILSGALLLIQDDIYKKKSEKDLNELIPKLKELGVNTDRNLIRLSRLYEKSYNFDFNKKIPVLVESKYILVPSHSISNKIVNTSILQEHSIGSSTYNLSVAAPNKELKLIYRRT